MTVRLSLIGFSFFISTFSFCQSEVLELFPDTEMLPVQEVDSASGLFYADAGGFFLPVDDMILSGVSVKLGGSGTRFNSAFAFDVLSTDKMKLPFDGEVLVPRYKYFFFGLDNEVSFFKSKRFSMLMHFKAGLGYKTYAEESIVMDTYYYAIDDSSSNYTLVYDNYSGILACNSFFAAETGVNTIFRLAKWMSLGISVNTRMAFGINEDAAMRDKSLYAASAFLRFRMPE